MSKMTKTSFLSKKSFFVIFVIFYVFWDFDQFYFFLFLLRFGPNGPRPGWGLGDPEVPNDEKWWFCHFLIDLCPTGGRVTLEVMFWHVLMGLWYLVGCGLWCLLLGDIFWHEIRWFRVTQRRVPKPTPKTRKSGFGVSGYLRIDVELPYLTVEII